MNPGALILDACRRVIPCVYGDANFTLVAPEYHAGGGTSCSWLPAFVWYAAGCRAGQLINRTIPGSDCRFDIGQGISKIWNGARAIGAWVPGVDGMKPGDVYLMHGLDLDSAGRWAPSTEHVGVIAELGPGFVKTYDFGEGTRAAQEGRLDTRTIHGANISSLAGPRIVEGYVSADLLTYPAAPLYGSGSQGAGPWLAAGAVLAGLAAVAVGWGGIVSQKLADRHNALRAHEGR